MNFAVVERHATGREAQMKGERERFREMAESELMSLHEENFARYQVELGEFATWQAGGR
jgi:hypothetical protein